MSKVSTTMSELIKQPVILVSAKSEAAASHFISQLIDNEPPEVSGGGAGRVWRIANKYYSADVRLLPAPDAPAAAPDPGLSIEGHIIYLAEDECSAEAGERRLDAGADAGVRVLAVEAPRLAPALRAWAARRRLEPVPLRAAAPGDDDDEDEPRGVPAVRAALHAHEWPGLRRARLGAECGAAGSSDGEDALGGSEDGAVERAESWAAALGRLDGVRALPPRERRAAAEALVGAFCRALGHDLDAL